MKNNLKKKAFKERDKNGLLNNARKIKKDKMKGRKKNKRQRKKDIVVVVEIVKVVTEIASTCEKWKQGSKIINQILIWNMLMNSVINLRQKRRFDNCITNSMESLLEKPRQKNV